MTERERVGPLPDAGHAHARALGRQHDRGRAVGDRTAVIEPQRIGDHAAARGPSSMRDRFAEVRQRVARAVRVVLDRDLRDLALADAVPAHEGAGDEGREAPASWCRTSARTDRASVRSAPTPSASADASSSRRPPPRRCLPGPTRSGRSRRRRPPRRTSVAVSTRMTGTSAKPMCVATLDAKLPSPTNSSGFMVATTMASGRSRSARAERRVRRHRHQVRERLARADRCASCPRPRPTRHAWSVQIAGRVGKGQLSTRPSSCGAAAVAAPPRRDRE